MSDSSNNAQSSFNPGASAKSRRIVFTGGGSAGHVTLNLALIPWFLEQGWQVSYIGSKGGMEQELVSRFSEVRYYGILTGKLRRYFSWQNFLDMAKIPLGCLQACWLVRKINPDIIFSKGGFVSFPVVVGGFVNRKRIFMHEFGHNARTGQQAEPPVRRHVLYDLSRNGAVRFPKRKSILRRPRIVRPPV
ncbi:MAG: glycosyltransferase [Alphaproteobacteria bacterium]